MKLGVTGHQERDGIDWSWVAKEITNYLRQFGGFFVGYSSLAAGTDQLFAYCALSEGGSHVAVIPMKGYRNYFDEILVSEYDGLLKQSDIINLEYSGEDDQAFLNAGKWISNNVNVMIAVWDGDPAEGKGGTADIVAYTLSIGKPVYHIDPIQRTVRDL